MSLRTSVVLRAANQNSNDCQWQSYLDLCNADVALSKDSLRSQSVFLLVCTEIGIVIANQSADWCGNPPDIPRTTGGAKRLPLLNKGSCHGRLTQGHD